MEGLLGFWTSCRVSQFNSTFCCKGLGFCSFCETLQLLQGRKQAGFLAHASGSHARKCLHNPFGRAVQGFRYWIRHPGSSGEKLLSSMFRSGSQRLPRSLGVWDSVSEMDVDRVLAPDSDPPPVVFLHGVGLGYVRPSPNPIPQPDPNPRCLIFLTIFSASTWRFALLDHLSMPTVPFLFVPFRLFFAIFANLLLSSKITRR